MLDGPTVRRWALGVERSMFASSVLFLEPRFPTAFEHKDVGELRFFAQAMGDFPAGVTAQATAIDDDFFARRPNRQKLRQQFIPPVFIQRNCTGNVIFPEIIVRPCINPDRSVPNSRAPSTVTISDGAMAERHEILSRK